eukprot:evm.model.NODE_51163_length_26315_cov_26.879385.3
MVRHLQLLVQNGAVMAHNLALNQGGGGEGGGEEKEAFLDVQAMVKDVHTLRDKAWQYFGFEPGPTGKGAYRERVMSTTTAPAPAPAASGGGEGGGSRGGVSGSNGGTKKKKEQQKQLVQQQQQQQQQQQGKKDRRFTRGAAQRMEGRSKSLMDVPGIAAAAELVCVRLGRVTDGVSRESGEITTGGLPQLTFVMRALDILWQGGGITVHCITLPAFQQMPPLLLAPPSPPPPFPPLPYDSFTPSETRLLIRGLVVAPHIPPLPSSAFPSSTTPTTTIEQQKQQQQHLHKTYSFIHSVMLAGRTPSEIAWYHHTTQQDPNTSRWRQAAIASLKLTFSRAPLAGQPSPFTPEEDALLWTGHRAGVRGEEGSDGGKAFENYEWEEGAAGEGEGRGGGRRGRDDEV